MHVLQFAKRSLPSLAAAAVALSGCGSESAPTVPFNPTGATADLEAVNTTFASPAFTSFSALSALFDGALGGSPLVSGSVAALNLRRTSHTVSGDAARAADRIARMVPRTPNGSFSAVSAAIPAELLGKTFVYNNGSYVVSDEPGGPANGVRFILYAVDPVTLLPVQPLDPTGYVDLLDLSSGSTSSARVMVFSGTTKYLDYRVTATSTLTSGKVTVSGSITDGITTATLYLSATLTYDAGLTLTYSLDVPQRDLSIDLTLTANGTTTETSTISMGLDMRGQNGWVRLTGEFSSTGGTLNVAINGAAFATITSALGAEPAITGAAGQPLAPEEIETLERVFEFSGGTFAAFDQLIAPVGRFIG